MKMNPPKPREFIFEVTLSREETSFGYLSVGVKAYTESQAKELLQTNANPKRLASRVAHHDWDAQYLEPEAEIIDITVIEEPGPPGYTLEVQAPLTPEILEQVDPAYAEALKNQILLDL